MSEMQNEELGTEQQTQAEEPTENNSVDQPTEQHQEAEAAPQKHDNIRALREAKYRAEQERDEMRRRMAELEQKMNAQPEPADDDYVEWRQVKTHLNKIQKQLTAQTNEQRLRQSYPDIDSVINSQTIAQLNELEPELARTIASNTNEYDKAVAAYKAIKRCGLYQDPQVQLQKKQIAQNTQKPQASNSVAPQEGDSPLHQANAFSSGLTPELKSKLWKEMQEAMGNKI